MVVTVVLLAAKVGRAIELKTILVAVPEPAVLLSVKVEADKDRYGPVVDGVPDNDFDISSNPAGAVVPIPTLPASNIAA